MPFFAAGLGVLDLGKVGMEAAHPLVSQQLLHLLEDGFHSLWLTQRTKAAGVQVPKVDAGDQPLIQGTQGQHLFQVAQLVELAHRFRAQVDVTQALLVHLPERSLQGIRCQLQSLLTGNLGAGAGVYHHPLRSHRIGCPRALQDIVDACQSLLLLNARQRDVVGRVQRQGHPLPGCQLSQLLRCLKEMRTPLPHWYS